MKNKNKKIDPLPDEFSSEQEAGEFWDTHSLTDYEEYLEPVKFKSSIKTRNFQIEVDENTFMTIRDLARRHKKPAKQIISEIVKQVINS